MFAVNSYAKIKEVESNDKYSTCKISISKKNKQTGKYETTFVGKVRFLGQAHLQRPLADQKIKITACGVSNCTTKDEKLEFLKFPSYVVFGYELQTDSHSNNTTSTAFELGNDEVLPF